MHSRETWRWVSAWLLGGGLGLLSAKFATGTVLTFVANSMRGPGGTDNVGAILPTIFVMPLVFAMPIGMLVYGVVSGTMHFLILRPVERLPWRYVVFAMFITAILSPTLVVSLPLAFVMGHFMPQGAALLFAVGMASVIVTGLFHRVMSLPFLQGDRVPDEV